MPAAFTDPLQQILDETRQRFIATFADQCDSIGVLVDMVAALGSSGPIAALTQLTHRLSGLAGTIGFPTISARASELEALVDSAGTPAFSAAAARNAVDAICGAYTVDLANPPVWAPPAAKAVQHVTRHLDHGSDRLEDQEVRHCDGEL